MNNPWFDEKSEQVTVNGFHAFGIRLDSRYGVARELAELLLFADAAATSGANLHVDHASYNSKTCCCEFELRGASTTIRRKATRYLPPPC